MGGIGSGRKPEKLLTHELRQLRVAWAAPMLEPKQSEYLGIALEWTSCNFGSERPWWKCPVCDRRSGILYTSGSDRWACRRCHGLNYTSQRLSGSPHLQRWGRIRRFQIKFSLPGDWDPLRHSHILPKRPKGMHYRRFQREVQVFWKLEEDFNQWLIFAMSEWLSKHE